VVVALGLTAAALTTGCWFPQLLRSWRTRSTRDLSWAYLAVLGLGITLWLVYGVAVGDPVIVAANGLTLMALATLAAAKLRFDRHQPPGSGR
jgi:MtN3 and saliva related transmembrane protein